MQLINSRKAQVSEKAVISYAKQKEYEFLTYRAIRNAQEEGIPNDEIADILGIDEKEAIKKTSKLGLERARARMFEAKGLLESF